MGQIESLGPERANLCDRLKPRFHLKFGRYEGRNRWTVTDPNAGNIAAEYTIIPVVNVMMTGMTRRFHRCDFEFAHTDDIAVIQHVNVRLRDRG